MWWEWHNLKNVQNAYEENGDNNFFNIPVYESKQYM